MAIRLPLNSRYKNTETVVHEGRETLGRWAGFTWLNSDPQLTIVADVANAGRPDMIANEYLGSPDFWWAIVYFNNATSVNWPRAGDEVAIPASGLVFGSEPNQ